MLLARRVSALLNLQHKCKQSVLVFLIGVCALMQSAPSLAQSLASRTALANMSLTQADAVTRMREVTVMGIWSSGAKKGLSLEQINQSVADYRTSFNGLVENANGDFDSKVYSDGLMDMSAAALKTVLKPLKLEALVPGIEALVRGPIDDAIYGDRIKGANDVLDSSYRTNTFFQPKLVELFEQQFSSSSAEVQSAMCESLGSRASNLNMNYCGNSDSIVSQIDQRGGSASLAIQVDEIQRRSQEAIKAGTYSPGQRQADIQELETFFADQMARSNELTAIGLNEVKDAINVSEANSKARDKKILSGVESNGEKLDQLIANENNRQSAEREAAEDAIKEARQDAELQDIYAVGNMVATIIGVLDPKAGKQAAAVVNAAISVNEALDQFSDLAKLGDVGGAALSGNLLNAAFTLFAAFQDTPSPESVILDQLVAIQQQLQDIQQQIQRIDEKLDTILSEMIAGFDRVQQGIDIILSDVAENTAIALETQLIVREESNRIYNALLETTYAPCTLAVLNNQTFEFPEYRRCAYLLFDYATDQVYDAEVSTSFEDTGASLRNNLLDVNTIGRSSNGLRKLYAQQNSNLTSARIASFESWYHAVTIYKDFLLHSPQQALEAFPNRQFGMNRLIDNAASIQEFRKLILDDLTKTLFFAPSQPSTNPVARLSTLNSQVVSHINSTIESELKKYNQKNSLSLSGIDQLLSAQPGAVAFANITNATNGTVWDTKLSTNTHRWLFTNAPNDIWKAVNAGLGTLQPQLNFTSTDTSKYDCGFLGLSTCLRAHADNYRIELYFTDNAKVRTRIGHMNFKVTNGAPRGLGSGFVSRGVKLCATATCIETGIANVSNGNSRAFILDNTSTLQTNNSKVFNGHRSVVAQSAFNEIRKNASSLTLPTGDNNVQRESVFFAATIRFAFAELLNKNDAVHAIASSEFAYPTLGSVLSQMSDTFETYDLADYMNSQYKLLADVMKSRSVKDLIAVASNTTEISNVIEELKQMDLFLQNVSVETTNTQPDPATNTGGDNLVENGGQDENENMTDENPSNGAPDNGGMDVGPISNPTVEPIIENNSGNNPLALDDNGSTGGGGGGLVNSVLLVLLTFFAFLRQRRQYHVPPRPLNWKPSPKTDNGY